MPRFVVLLRGVNVGGAKRVPMAELRAMLEALGYGDVQTLLHSGNAVVDSRGRSGARHVEAISGAIERTFGFSVEVVVRSAVEWATVLRESPIRPADGDHSSFLVALGVDAAALRALAPLSSLARASERFVVTDHAAYLSCPGGLRESAVAKALLGKAGRAVTTRNWATAIKIDALLRGADPRAERE